MAHVPVPPKGGTPWWTWLLALLATIGLIWLIAGLFDDEPDAADLAAVDDPDEVGAIDDTEYNVGAEDVASMDAATLTALADERREEAQGYFSTATSNAGYVEAAALWEAAAMGYLGAEEHSSAAAALVDASKAYQLANEAELGLQALERGLRYAGADPAALQEARGVARELESMLAGRPPVRAVIDSVPDEGVAVEFWRFVEPNGPRLSATTNDTVPLDPALYTFAATLADGSALPQQTKDCSRPCRIRFVTQ